MKSTSSAEIRPIPRLRRLKRFILGIVVAAMIIGVLAFAVWKYIRSESFNNYVAGEIKSNLREFGLRVEIGRFGISWDTETARFRNLKIYNERTGQLVATIKRLDTLISINDPLALEASREIAIKTVDIKGADFYFEIDREGRTNLDGFHYVTSKSETIKLNTARTITTITGSAIHFKDLSRQIEAEAREAQATVQAQLNDPNSFNLNFNSAAGRASYAGRDGQLGKLDLKALVSKDGAEVEGLSLESNVAQVKARGRIANWAAPRYGFDFNSQLKLDEASRAMALDRSLKGGAAINGRIDG